MRPEIVLLVEDEPLLRAVLREGLECDGFRVATASTADVAWEQICGGLEFDILVTDVRMPGRLDGLDLARMIYTERPGVRIVVMSGFSSLNEFDHNMGAFLRKPFTSRELQAMLSQS